LRGVQAQISDNATTQKPVFFAPDLLPGIHDNDDEDHGPHTEASLSQVMVPSWGMG
jgi:hypothetical protein